MTRTKKLYGFRIGERIPEWKDRFGKSEGKIINLIWLKHLKQCQIVISNGDILTTEFILSSDFFRRGLNN